MENIPDNLNKMLDDIKYIRTAIEQNSDDLRKLLYTKIYRICLWIVGIGIIVFAFLYYDLIHYYGTFEKAPFESRMILIFTTILFFLAEQILEFLGWREVKKLYPGMSVVEFFFKLAGRHLIVTYGALFTLTALFSFYFGCTGYPQFIYPAAAIGFGLVMTIMGNAVSFLELTLAGLMFLIPGTVSIPFIIRDPLSAWIWAGISFGLAFIVMEIIIEVNLFFNKRKRGKNGDGK